VLEVAKTTLLIITALFPIVDPLGGSPIFLTLTHDYPREARRLLSRQIAVNSFIVLIVSYLIGAQILAFFGISLPVVQVGGGLVLMSTGWALLKAKDEEEQERAAAPRDLSHEDVLRHAFYPMTLPLTVGPGSISVAITLGANAPRHFGPSLLSIVGALLGSFLIAVSIFICYGFSDRLAVLLGPTGMNVIMRLSSFLLVCIGVQILWNGVSALLQSLPQTAH
jgi:multiple antibiotic resistance protein